MASGLFGISLSGLSAAQANLSTTSQNIANVNTAGYHRETTNQVNSAPQWTSSGVVGSGVEVASVTRAYSSFLENQVTSSQTQLSSYQTYNQYATQLNSLLGDQNSALSSSLSDFNSNLQNVANDPTSTVARQTLISSGNALVGQFQAVSSGLNSIQQGVNQQVQTIASQVTSYAKSIAALNVQITAAQASNSSNANTLMDQRDELVSQLNQLVNVNVVNQSGSGYNVYIGNGQSLVAGSQANSMSTVENPSDPSQLLPAITVGNSQATLTSAQITGGQLGGLLAFTDQMLNPTQAGLGNVANTLVTQINSQSVQGFDLSGTQGTAFFNIGQGPQPIVASTGNTGTGVFTLSLTDSSQVANESGSYTLSFNGTNYSLSDGTTSYSNSTISGLNSSLTSAGLGFNVNMITGAMQSGDSYTITPSALKNVIPGLSVAITNPSQIAAAGPGITSAYNGSTAGVNIVASGALPSSANPPLTLTYNASGTITAVDSASPQNSYGPFTYTSGNPLSFDGVSVTITGAPANNDTFTLSSNPGVSAGNGDNSNVLMMADANNLNTLKTAFNQMVAQNATLTNSATTNQETFQTLTNQATQAQQSFSGVNLDTEAANLIQYQQAYQAAAKSLQVASTLFNSILTAIQ